MADQAERRAEEQSLEAWRGMLPRLVGILVVAEGQINIGEQQVNVAGGERMEGTERRRPGRSARSQHRRRAPQGAAASLTHRRCCHGR
ncbi:MAG: hypothetical protein M3Q71_25190 [Chloroflexota bacterium]|nr:hypothetical protein [Chloroflexota bacterium]